jgi:hypothetical protein
MIRLMMIAVAAGSVLLATSTGASAQLAGPTSCSEAKGVCSTGCGRQTRVNLARNLPVDRCLRLCARREASCFRTGTFRGRMTWSGLRRA